MKICLLCAGFVLATLVSTAQKIFTKEGRISFYSKTAMENIEATNTRAVGVIDTNTGDVEFSVLMKGFEFEKALMQEHFNENYVESDKYPKATFKGRLKDNPQWKTDGVYKSAAEGLFTLHGVTKPQTVPVTITIKNGITGANAEMKVLLADYAIKVPSLVGNKISESITVTIAVPSFSSLTK